MEHPISMLFGLISAIRVRYFNPTRDWPECTFTRLEYDLRTGRLNGLAPDGPIDGARVFGKADWFSGRAESPDFDYRRLGLQIGCYTGTICNFRVILQPASRHGARDRAFQAADFTLIAPNGKTCRLWGNTSEQDLIALLGAPIETGPIVNDRVHTFSVNGTSIDSHHDEITGQLLELTLTLEDPMVDVGPDGEPREHTA
ncbi:MAG TPA: hypothetical protein VJY35_05565 [Candidatus Eisenbacteria bacterium]|nr:hypothetical protein [Candidatus Eisenbacteria bacterium]